MKKITMFALLCAAVLVPSMKAQEVTYVEDPSQGYTFNRFQDNWFISAEGGAGVWMSDNDSKLDFGKRIMPTVDISVGKWFSPIIGLRLSIDGKKMKGLTSQKGLGVDPINPTDGMVDGYYVNRLWSVGPTLDVMLNLTNWWCGYRPGRVYNAIFYGGGAVHTTWAKEKSGDSDKLKYQYTNFGFRLGLLNTFALTKQVDFLLDLRADVDESKTVGEKHFNSLYGTVMAGFAYKFKKRTWTAPIVPVCPQYKYTDAEGDNLVARLQAADAKIASLEQQLRDCLNKKTEAVAPATEAPIATIYFPIGSSKVSGTNAKLCKAVANVMKDNKDDNYTLVGWADNYTGTAKLNSKLRANRAANVKKVLVRSGVASNRLETKSEENNLTNYGKGSASLDRAVTINVAK